MRRMTLLFAVVFLLHHAVTAFTVSGKVTDYIANAPAADFSVRLIGISPAATTDSARTGVDGRYSFTGVPAGAYQIKLDDGRYAADSQLATVTSDTDFSFVALALSHVITSGNFPDTLTKAGSPYLVRDMISSGKQVVIAPGAKIVVFQYGFLKFDSDVSALGNATDSIVFTAGYRKQDTGSIGYIELTKPQGTYRFAYCRFERLDHVDANGQTPNLQQVSVEHCLFDSLYRAFLISAPVQKFLFAYNRVVGCNRGVGPLGDGQVADTCEVTDNYLQSSIMTLTMRPTIAGKCYVRRNTVMGPMLMDCMRLSTRDTIASNIFSSDSFLFANNKTLFFAYNNHMASHGTPLGIGTNALVNTKGDSCDAYFNIIKNPLFADSATGVLLSTSPCIKTGMGGVENMGVYQGPGVTANIAERKPPHQGEKGIFKVISNRLPGKGTTLEFSWEAATGAWPGWISVYSVSGILLKRIPVSQHQASAKMELSKVHSGVIIALINCGSFREAMLVTTP